MEREVRQSPNSVGAAYPAGTSELANSAVSALLTRQATTATGARQFVLDHLVRAVTHKGEFDARAILDELRGHRLQADAVIDIYIPAVARMLGDFWLIDRIDFATVTIGSVRLQALLNAAVGDPSYFSRVLDDAPYFLVALMPGQQHSLGGFVLATQLRRYGARVEVSFCEAETELAARLISDTPDGVLYSVSTPADLEHARHSVLNISRVMSHPPAMCIGGSLFIGDNETKDVGSADLVSCNAREVMDFVMRRMHSRASAYNT